MGGCVCVCVCVFARGECIGDCNGLHVHVMYTFCKLTSWLKLMMAPEACNSGQIVSPHINQQQLL